MRHVSWEVNELHTLAHVGRGVGLLRKFAHEFTGAWARIPLYVHMLVVARLLHTRRAGVPQAYQEWPAPAACKSVTFLGRSFQASNTVLPWNLTTVAYVQDFLRLARGQSTRLPATDGLARFVSVIGSPSSESEPGPVQAGKKRRHPRLRLSSCGSVLEPGR